MPFLEAQPLRNVDGQNSAIRNGAYFPQLIRLSRSIAAVQAAGEADGQGQLGLISHLPAGSEVRVCGCGFSEQTLKVACFGAYYYVFAADLKQHTAEPS